MCLHLFFFFRYFEITAPQYHYYRLLIVIKCYIFNTFYWNQHRNSTAPQRSFSLSTIAHTVQSNVLYLFYVLVFWVLNWHAMLSSKLPFAKIALCMSVSRARASDEGRCLTRSNAKLCTTFPWSFLPWARMRENKMYNTKCWTCFKYTPARSRPFTASLPPMQPNNASKYLN